MKPFPFISKIAALMLLVSCAPANMPQGKYMPMQTFENVTPVVLSVREKLIKTSPMQARTQTTFPYNLSEMVRIYLDRKLAPAGQYGWITATLEEAQVEDAQEKAESKAAVWLNVGGYDVYKVRLAIRLEHRDDNNDLLYSTRVHGERQVRISQHVSIAEREADLFEGLEKLFVGIDAHINKVLTQDMRITQNL